jgi:CRP-like cAMP-binding protein
MADPIPNEPHNRLLARMSCADLALLQPHLQPVVLRFRQRLEAANRKITTAYFLENGIASVVAIGGGGSRLQAEIGIVGREGMTGVPILLGMDRSPYDTLMQLAGEGQCIATGELRRAMKESRSLAAFLLRYAYSFFVQAGSTALANARGKVEERLARWLLMAHDRVGRDELALTHEFLSVMLGVRRAGVTSALHRLESLGLISTGRGNIVMLDREGVARSANGLYGVPEAEYGRLFPA